jgi:hypothetical protein
MPWHFKGSKHYVEHQARRLGMSDAQVKRALRSDELSRVNHFLSQLSDRHKQARTVDGQPVFHPPEIAQIEAVIFQAEQEVGKLHMLAATSCDMIDECRAAFGLRPTKRPFEVMSDSDVAPAPHVPSASTEPIAAVVPAGSKA